ncbi:hypothetical protein DFR50_116116 [Roseiarcus fermentans]|uniref:Uncharacterized protein n=1 Tax=Roseiarcus fermentans TaxID=1473586 RepID=A0A366F9X6_9HYPH|nr:hypothetical protein [Roseiarcus fermentans]RBP11421.1 hypothetical protein DFR50_116116 [Roseiarcus fermentans]
MLRIFAAASFAALVAATPLAAVAQTEPGAHPHDAHQPTRSYRSEMRNRRAQVHHRARAGAEHVRQMHEQ